MALMIPAVVSPNTRSNAERKLFQLIKTQLADDWTAFHSLGLASHPGKPWAEVDFVLVGPQGVFCVEVKGGRVFKKAGMWHFMDRNGNVSTKYEGPFEQAGSAAAALRSYLLSSDRRLGEVVVGYGVMLPDCELCETAPDVIPEITYDLRDRSTTFSSFIRRLTNYWYQRIEAQRGRPVHSLTAGLVSVAVRNLRPNFDLRPSLSLIADDTENALLALTQEQYAVLDGLVDHDRCIIRGGAGTGKTLLAVEEAKRRSNAGEKVLLCCRNPSLAAFLSLRFEDDPKVECRDIGLFMKNIVERAGLTERLPEAEDQDLFGIFYPELCVEGMESLDEIEAYDCLIVDEAQDLLLHPFLDVFDFLLKGSLETGKWMFFMDPLQDLHEALSHEGLVRLDEYHPVSFRLTMNCRNTRPIAIANHIVTGVDCLQTMKIDGPPVEHYWWHDRSDQLRQLEKCINRWLGDKVEPSRIVILSSVSLEISGAAGRLSNVPYPVLSCPEGRLRTPGAIGFSTIDEFKGLESDVLAVIDVDDIESPLPLIQTYVAASRARAILALFLSDTLQGLYDERAFIYGQRMVGRDVN